MSRYPGKKLPPHWVYVPSPREVRALVSASAADFRRVEFGGPSKFRVLARLERRVVDEAWRFGLWLNGVPESLVGDRRDQLGQAAIDAIKRSVADLLAVPSADGIKPSETLLWLKSGPDGAFLEATTKEVDRYSWFARDSWWEESNRD